MHIRVDDLELYFVDRLAPRRRSVVQRHVADCAVCAKKLDKVKTALFSCRRVAFPNDDVVPVFRETIQPFCA